MAFTREAAIVPESIADISIELFDPDPNDEAASAGAAYSVQVRMSDGTIVVRRGNLVPHLTPAQINGLLSFMAAMRVQAESELLPLPE